MSMKTKVKKQSPYADKGITVVEAMRDPRLFGDLFQPADSWKAWVTALKALKSLPLEPEEVEAYIRHTGRTLTPETAAREAAWVIGRQGGKSNVAALLAVHQACFIDHSAYLKPRQRAVVMLLAQHRKGSGALFGSVLGLLEHVPALKGMIVKVQDAPDDKSIKLSNGVTIEVFPAHYKSVRGPMILAALCDESAFWWSDTDSANPDREVLRALRPGMLHVPTAFLLQLSSPYAKKGALWDTYDKHFGKDGDRLQVWQATTQAMYPGADPDLIAAAYEEDPESAAAEFGARFRDDVAGFITSETLAVAVVEGREVLPYQAGTAYCAFVDPAGGGKDSYTLALAHRTEEGKVVLDLVREYRAPLWTPAKAVADVVAICRAYRIGYVTGDNYGKDLAQEPYRTHNMPYRVSGRVRSDLYLALLPLLNSHRVELLDHPKLRAQALGLERRTTRAGRDSVDHGRNGHDDLINAAAGALVLASLQAVILVFASLDEEIAWEERHRPEGSYEARERVQVGQAEGEVRAFFLREYTTLYGAEDERTARLATQKTAEVLAYAHQMARQNAGRYYQDIDEEDPTIFLAYVRSAMGLDRLDRAREVRGYDLRSGREIGAPRPF